MNRIDKLFAEKPGEILSLYFTAGYPVLDCVNQLIPVLELAGADLLEIGMPFSDPLADGPVIQASSQEALAKGMNLDVLFSQLMQIETKIPLILMGYFNPVYQYGLRRFLEKCNSTNISGLIIPDLPIDDYLQNEALFQKYNIHNILLVTPETSTERLQMIDGLSGGFIYVVSSSSTTGARTFSRLHHDYFERLASSGLLKPRLIGFGIKDNHDFTNACKYANGAIIGSQFVTALKAAFSADGKLQKEVIFSFVSGIRQKAD